MPDQPKSERSGGGPSHRAYATAPGFYVECVRFAGLCYSQRSDEPEWRFCPGCGAPLEFRTLTRAAGRAEAQPNIVVYDAFTAAGGQYP